MLDEHEAPGPHEPTCSFLVATPVQAPSTRARGLLQVPAHGEIASQSSSSQSIRESSSLSTESPQISVEVAPAAPPELPPPIGSSSPPEPPPPTAPLVPLDPDRPPRPGGCPASPESPDGEPASSAPLWSFDFSLEPQLMAVAVVARKQSANPPRARAQRARAWGRRREPELSMKSFRLARAHSTRKNERAASAFALGAYVRRATKPRPTWMRSQEPDLTRVEDRFSRIGKSNSPIRMNAQTTHVKRENMS
jgi:hypothetical protein